MSYAKGLAAEAHAAQFLYQQGLQILHQNYRCKLGEIDIIARQGTTLCFVEVRFRRRSTFGAPIATITDAKRRRLVRTASHFLLREWVGKLPACRFDVVTIEGSETPVTRWWRGAFEAEMEG